MKSRLNLAAVGIGGQGSADLEGLKTENIVALCDVDADFAAHTSNDFPHAKRYTDFRVMLEKEKGIDAVRPSDAEERRREISGRRRGPPGPSARFPAPGGTPALRMRELRA